MSSENDKVVVGKYGPFSMISMGLPGDHAGKTAVRIFMVQGSEKTALIDSGLYAGYPDLEKGFVELGMEKSDLDYVLCTHEHMDHVGNNAQLVEESGCEVLAHEGRADRIADNMLNAKTIVHAFPEVEPLFPLEEEYLDWMGPNSAPVHGFLKEGDIVDLGDIKLEVVELMGHSMGEIGFFHEESKILVFADPLLPDYNPVLYLYEDSTEMHNTFKKIEDFIRERGVETVLSSHDHPCSGEDGIAWAQDCDRRVTEIEDATLEVIKNNPGIDMGELRNQVCDRFEKVREWRALVSMNAILNMYEAQGLIRKEGNGWAHV